MGDIKGERPIFEIWKGTIEDEIHIIFDGMTTISLDADSFKRLINALKIAESKIKPE